MRTRSIAARGLRLGLAAATAILILPSMASPARAQARAPAHDFTLEQALSAPFPSDLAAAPQGGRVAWVYDAKGARNVWVAEAGPGGAYRGRAVTSFTGDDGFDMGQLSWAADGRQVFFTRGGSLEGGGPVNIMSLASGAPPQTVWAATLDGAPPRQIGPGNSPAASPKGDVVAYVSGGQIWTAPMAGGAPSQLIHDRGEASALAWSPDGAKLAFVSTRTDHALIGVYDTTTRTIAWMAPSVDADMAPEWSPDSRRLAFVRVPADTQNYFFENREGYPWSIWVGDPATGAARMVWQASPGPGSVFHPILSDRVLMWTAGDRLVFPWERTGWVHLYSVVAVGGVAEPLTPAGEYEVFNIALSPDRNRIVYSSNQGDIDRRHLWSIAAGGSAARELTHDQGIEDFPAVASDGRVVTLHSDAQNPVRPAAATDGGALADLAPGAVPADFPASRLVAPQQVVFNAADGLAVHGQLFLPPPGRRARGPAVLFFHGGPIRQMLLGWHPMDAYSYMYAMNQYLANEGYVVLSVNYRGGIGYGMDFREPVNFGAGGASELNDILGAALYLRTRGDVDPARIGVWGGSYGGLMTALGLSRASGLLAAGVDYAGVHDWRAMLPQLSQPGAPAGAAQLAYDSSAMATLDKWRSPVLVVHSDDDRNVPFDQTVMLVEGLRKHHVEVEQVILPDEIHDLLREQSWLTLFHSADDFFGRHLMTAPQPTATQP